MTTTQFHIREGTVLTKAIGAVFLTAMQKFDGYLAGGAVRSLFSSEPINDFDIFFGTEKSYNDCREWLNTTEQSPSFSETDSAATHISQGLEDGIPKARFQLIKAIFGEPADIVASFDFTMCMAAWLGGHAFILDEFFLKHVAQRRLHFNPLAKYPICSLWRAQKFIARGWKLPAIESIKLALTIQHLNLTDFGVLKEQLMGIDTIFLQEMTDAMAGRADQQYDFGEAIAFIGGFFDSDCDN